MFSVKFTSNEVETHTCFSLDELKEFRAYLAGLQAVLKGQEWGRGWDRTLDTLMQKLSENEIPESFYHYERMGNDRLVIERAE